VVNQVGSDQVIRFCQL